MVNLPRSASVLYLVLLLMSAACALVGGRSMSQVVAHDSLDPVSSSHQDMHLRSASRNAALDWFASDHAGHARWLVHATDYAIVSTNSTMKEGWPFSNVVSISDGAAAQSTGRIIIYVATMSQFAADVEADSKVSVGVSQAQANGGQGCKYIDVEWPMCARANVFGHAKLVPKEAEQEAAGIMFARHPQMKAWAALAHTWAFYEIGITDVRVLDFFGGYHRVTPEEYFAATPREPLLQAEPLPR